MSECEKERPVAVIHQTTFLPAAVPVYKEMFRSDLSDQEAFELARKSLSFVEVELFTFCNRTCTFCPNHAMKWRQDRKGPHMNTDLYYRILQELRAIDYSGTISYSRYNEPLAFPNVILGAIRSARDHLPNATLMTHTNGDYLTRDYLDELRKAGLNLLRIQTYLGNGEEWNDRKMLRRQETQLRRLGLAKAQILVEVEGMRYFHYLNYPGMEVTLDARNFKEIGTDRGGSLPHITPDRVRTSPCLVPLRALYIDWNGCTVPCCNIRSDLPEHEGYVVADLSRGISIYRAFAELYGWRQSLLNFLPKAKPCDTCTYEMFPFSFKMDQELKQARQ